ncbi:uncharacterized protein K02A2.6-like [Diaphorina citri]|uniref:Uncharacterized protein K02A2.6-like n=1 Tax=Diaphorina citri TaxID=121845 RepID=A0A3Q0JIZ3_DIACI|nr:uncharacterized protein K02A2.6-like [Diaphorina citri]
MPNSGEKPVGNQTLLGHVAVLANNQDARGWLEQFEAFCTLNAIPNDKKVLLFISYLGPTPYNSIREMCLPATPTDKSYKDLKKLLLDYVSPPPNFFIERYNFRERRQLPNETISEYVKNLKKLSEFCKYADKLEDALRDQLVWGIRDPSIKRKLLADGGELPFPKCVELAVSMETAIIDCSTLSGHNNGQVMENLNFIKGRKNQFKKKPSQSLLTSQSPQSSFNSKPNSVVCYCCGQAGHVRPSCRYRNHHCKKCHKKGHITSNCKPVHYTDIVNEFSDLSVSLNALFSIEPDVQNRFAKPISIKLLLNGIRTEFQVDTGSAITAMNEDYAKGIVNIENLLPTKLQVKVYNSDVITPLGVAKVKVNDLLFLDLYIFDSKSGPPIVGRDWLIKLGILNVRHDGNINIDVTDNNYDCNSLSVSESKCLVTNLLTKYPLVFSDTVGSYQKSVSLKLKPDAIPVFHKPRPLPFALKEKVAMGLDKLVKDGVIFEVDSSDWASPIVPVIKPDGSLRICGDYKVSINKNLVVDKHPIPRISDLISSIKGNIFAKLDLSQAYLQIPLCPESQLLTTISTHRGLFCYKKLPFGIASAPSLFVREMEKIFFGLEGTLVYFDDIFICGKDKSELNHRIEIVLQKLQDNGLTLRKEKCEFFKDSVEFLGFKIDKNGTSVPSSRIEAIRAIKTPCNVTELKSFLGLVTYYTKFIPNMAQLASPLYLLLRKDQPWVWSVSQNKAFTKIIDSIVSSGVLAHYDPQKETIVSTDASDFGIAGVLWQVHDKVQRPVAFCSRTLNFRLSTYFEFER